MGSQQVVVGGLAVCQRAVWLLESARGFVAYAYGPVHALDEVVVPAVVGEVDVANVGIEAVAAAFGDSEFLLPRLVVARESIRDDLGGIRAGPVAGVGEDGSRVHTLAALGDMAHEKIAGLAVDDVPEPLPVPAVLDLHLVAVPLAPDEGLEGFGVAGEDVHVALDPTVHGRVVGRR